ncbi:MAG TPA: hypothetical protein EYP56_00820 [Planctomycetaceae bacterium]|nr:hypothetical protein [Planctomycetaceae bacterium]HIQ20985.1 hypothetical protein [Planctomycetota bacterium]
MQFGRFGRVGQIVGWAGFLAAVAALSGCTTLATAMYIFKGTDVDAEFSGLRDKRVAVVCRPVANLEIRSQNAARQIAQTLSQLLGQRVSRIEVIDQQEVADWTDNNLWEEYVEVGQALNADLVVGVDLERFSILEGQTIYRGKADVAVMVYDCHNGQRVYEKHLPQIVYPPNHVVSASEQREAEFRRRFVRVVADQVGRLFYRHDRYADFARDADALH